MSNNINVTEGSGKTVATEDISSAQYQKIKVVDGTTSGTTGLKINADGSLLASVYGNVGATIANTNINVSGSVVAFQGGQSSTSITGTITIGAITGASSILVINDSPRTSLVSGITSIITSTSQTSVLLTAAGGQSHHITHILVTNGASTPAFVDIMSGAQVIYSGYAAASGGGFSSAFPTPLRTPNAATSVDMKSSAQASIKVAIVGFTAA